MMKIEITLSEAEAKALAYVAEDPVFLVNNWVHVQCSQAIELIFNEEIQRMLADPSVTEIPADREKVVLQANLKTAAERYSEPPPFVGD